MNFYKNCKTTKKATIPCDSISDVRLQIDIITAYSPSLCLNLNIFESYNKYVLS